MSQKKQLLHELLQEDQEPFHLKDYIKDRSYQLRKTQQAKPKPYHILVKKRNPVSVSSSSFQASNFTCRNPCFFALTNSPDPRRSPAAFLDLHSPAGKSPLRATPPDAVFLHVPAKTASLLLEAALRIQKQSTSRPKSGSLGRANGFGLFGSLFKRLSTKNNNKKVKGITSSNVTSSNQGRDSNFLGRGNSETPPGFACPRNGRRSSTVWSGSSEEKSSLDLDLDLESFTSSSGSDSDQEEIFREVIESSNVEFVNGNYNLEVKNNDLGFHNEDKFCESPFRFVLLRSPSSPGCRTPEFLSPATSPSRQNIQDQEHNNVGGSLKFQVQRENYEAEKDVEEDKEQCSPVSVLDPPFEDDDDDACDDDQVEEDEEDGFDLQCSYAIVQKAKKQLLRKLRKFEKLAGLDPVELEKRMLNQDDDPHRDASGSEEEAMESPSAEKNIDRFIMEELQIRKIPRDMKRLVSDVIDEEGRQDQAFSASGELMTKRVCKRFESWKDVECNTIDMMVEMDFNGDRDQWKRCREQVEEAVLQIEVGIFGLLMEELTEEMVILTEIQ